MGTSKIRTWLLTASAVCCGAISLAAVGAPGNAVPGRTYQAAAAAVRDDDTEVLSALLDEEPGLARQGDSDGRALLYVAASAGASKAAGMLIDAGADLEARGTYGRTALHLAAEGDRGDIVRALLEAGAEVDALDDFSSTPLLLAAHRGLTGVAEHLLEAGADLFAIGSGSETPSISRRGPTILPRSSYCSTGVPIWRPRRSTGTPR